MTTNDDMIEKRLEFSTGITHKTSLLKLPIAASSTISRRSFNLAAASFVLAALNGFYNLNNHLEKEREKLKQKLEKQKEHREMICDFLFGQSLNQYYTPSFHNPYSSIKGMTIPTRDALFSVFSHLGCDPNEIENLEEPEPQIVDGSLLLVGGPVPNRVSRTILGVGEGSPLFQKALGKEIHLPVHFANIKGSEIGPGNRPQYQIVVNNKPISVSDGKDDFLVITSIPNVYSSQYGLGHRLVNLAGFHGGGTRAIDLVLKDEWLGKIYSKINNSPEFKNVSGWQAIICVRVDNENKPLGIINWNAFRINMDEEDFARAHDYVSINGIPLDTDTDVESVSS